MARTYRLETYNAVLERGVVPLFYSADVEAATHIVRACATGGARVIEFTNRGENALTVFAALANTFEKDSTVILGVGSIVDAPTAALFIAHGANFIVGPSFNPEIAKLCNKRKIGYIPGCGTENEISLAEEYGAEIVKIFPGESVGGPSFVSAVMAPCPWHKLLPTGGVDATPESVSSWIKAGAAAVGMGSKLITAQAVKEKTYEVITEKVLQTIGWIKQARGTPLFLGLEHVGLYPRNALASDVSAWYEKVFGFQSKEGNSSFMLGHMGAGRVEVVKENDPAPCHLAVRVSNFEEAISALKAKGIAVKEPNTNKPEVKAAYLQDPDPAGNLVHLLWLAN